MPRKKKKSRTREERILKLAALMRESMADANDDAVDWRMLQSDVEAALRIAAPGYSLSVRSRSV